MGSILVLDEDQPCKLAQYLLGRGHEVEAVPDASAILPILAGREFDLIFVNGTPSGVDGFAVLRNLLRHHPDARIALASLHPSIQEAVDAIQAGAFGYLQRPLSQAEVEILLERAANLGSARARADNTPPLPAEGLWSSANQQMAHAIATARRVAASDLPILLTGENGTGKRTLAAAIHGWSGRSTSPFVTVWCSALTDHHLDGSLLEHLHGACTGIGKTVTGHPESLGNGTLFFDEIGNGALPAGLQVKLLNHFESLQADGLPGMRKEIAARIIAASEHDLEADMASGRLRKQLFFHLNIVTIALPPLRHRIQDLPDLCDHFLTRLAARHRRAAVRLTPEAECVLAEYHWPGNLLELMTVLERAVVTSPSDRIGGDHMAAMLPRVMISDATSTPAGLSPPRARPETTDPAAARTRRIRRALKNTPREPVGHPDPTPSVKPR